MTWRRGLIIACATIVAFLVAMFGAAWYLSGRALAVTHVADSYPLRVAGIDIKVGIITLDRGPDAAEPGSFRLAWPGGRAVISAIVGSTPATVTRRLSGIQGRLEVGDHVGVEPDFYTGDPRSALGLAFSTVSVPSALGGMPAWWVPGRRSTWVVVIHGFGGSRVDALPVLPALHALGYPVLVVSYRNDAGAPQSLDRRSHLGASEWHDVDAAVTYAMGHGASGVVLYGFSLGGGMALVLAGHAPARAAIRAVVLDSPVLDWLATLDYAARRRGVPRPLAIAVERVLARRIKLDYAQFDQLRQERYLRAPVLLVQGGADTVVPPALAARFAHARPDLVTYLAAGGADHVSAIDTDSNRYRRALDRFLAAYP